MHLAELNATTQKLNEKIDHLEHIVGNLANALNLYITQEERLKNNISYMVVKATLALEDSEMEFTPEILKKALLKIDVLVRKIDERIEELENGPAAEED